MNLSEKVRRRALEMQASHKGLRKGQALMNALCELNREVYERIHSSDADCFYDDKKIRAFFFELQQE
jgi:hypothetical protein